MSLRSFFGIGPAAKAAAIARDIDAGVAAYESGDLTGAEHAFAAALARDANHPRALHLMGVARLATGDAHAAEGLIRRALAADPAAHLQWFNLGNALVAQGRIADAAEAFAQATGRAPGHFASWFNLARARADLGDLGAAIEACEHCANLQPDDPSALTELGSLRFRRAETTLLVADFDLVIDILRHALTLPDPPAATVHNARLILGQALSRRGRHSEALTLFQSAQRDAPDDLDANINLANCLNSMGRLRDAAPHYERVARLFPAHLPAVSSAISAANYAGDFDALPNARWRDDLMRLFADPRRHRHWPNPRVPERRLRLGYVSPDFRDHVAMRLLEGVLVSHNRERFEICIYDAAVFRDLRNRELRAHADLWREIDTLSTGESERLIRADGIDILVDLAGHTSGNRLMVFARKPAPVQVTWLAYPGSTGLPEIDYIISDPFTTPPDCEGLFSERVWRLPVSRFCFSPPQGSPESRMPAEDMPPTFGSFNNPSKLNAEVLRLWARVLDAVPGSRLLLKYGALDDSSAREWMRSCLTAAGFDLRRVEMRGWTRYLDALDQYADMHVALDPFPFCGGLTSLDALWMGVPVVTLTQPQMAGRQTEAFLRCLGEGDLVAEDKDRYVHIAAGLVSDRQRLVRYRAGLRESMRRSALLDHVRFTRDLETALRGMWRAWCEQGGTQQQVVRD